MVVYYEINIQASSINQESNNAVSVMLCMKATFIKENSGLLASIVSFDTA